MYTYTRGHQAEWKCLRNLGIFWIAGNFLFPVFFSCENKLIPVNFVYDSSGIPALQTRP
jgi:hypothetical protein